MNKTRLVTICFILVALGLIITNYELKAGWFDFLFMSQDVLSVSGNKLLLNKQAVIVRGVAMGDPHSREKVDRRTTADYEIIKKDWRANVVRLSIHPGVFKKDIDEMDKILEKEVRAARDQGLLVIIDWHVIGLPNGWYKPSAWGEEHAYSYDSNFNTAKEFWELIAVKYRGDRGVMFELWNEPADPKENNWKNIKPYLERLYDIIRSQGAANLIIAPGVWWTYDLRGIKSDPLKGENIAYSWHNYPNNTRYLSWNQALDGLNTQYPIIITEWGYESDPADSYYNKADYAKNLKKFILDKGLSFTAWCWHGSWKPRLLEGNWRDLTEAGKFVKSFLAELDITAEEKKTTDMIKNQINSRLDDFLYNGLDENSKKLGAGERAAVVYSFKIAFNRLPESQTDLDDIIKISNGYVPGQKSLDLEKWGMNEFYKIYLRPAKLSDQRDYIAVMVMAYGLRQKAPNRNLISEAQGLKIFKAIFKKLPASSREWNILQAITYSGAKR